MATFIVKTWEEVEGTYEVEAATEEEARAKFTQDDERRRLIDWTDVEQRDYMAFDVEVRSIANAR